MALVVYGAGKIGRVFLEKMRKSNQYEEIMFYDNNKNLPDEILGCKRIDEIRECDDIIITCGAWQECYRDCISKGFEPIGIYDEDDDKIKSYLEMCRCKRSGYINDLGIEYETYKKNRVDEGADNFLKTSNIFDNITEIAIMISNLCNYALIHPQCPANRILDKEIMPSSLVFKLLDELAESTYSGTIAFHVYNEPLMDPRLFWFMHYAKEKMPDCKLRIYTNAYYLNQVMVSELIENGMDILQVTAYGENEYDRLLSLEVSVPYTIIYGELDDRLDGYGTRKSVTQLDSLVCKSFFTQTTVFSNGDLGICCLDYKHSFGIGNMYSQSLRDCLNSGSAVELQKKLLMGDRSTYPICMNCSWNTR